MASGTIEGEAEFISASPTVKFEGAGRVPPVRQMTMNKANTMCLGGAQNPSVTVSEELIPLIWKRLIQMAIRFKAQLTP